ncbi:MAG: hypothetical protein ACTSRP_17115 [Candidatus Helarchaeota archaeon]
MKILIYSENLTDKSFSKIHSEANSVWEVCKRMAKYVDLTILTKKAFIKEKVPENINIKEYSEFKIFRDVFSKNFDLVHQLHQFALSPLYFLKKALIPRVISGDIIGTKDSDEWIEYHLRNAKSKRVFLEILICKFLNIK